MIMQATSGLCRLLKSTLGNPSHNTTLKSTSFQVGPVGARGHPRSQGTRPPTYVAGRPPTGPRSLYGASGVRPGNPQFPFPRFPIWPGIGEGIPDSRFGRNRESGNPPFPDLAGNRESGSRLAANREIGDTPLCEYIMHDPGLDVALSPSNADSGLPPHFSTA